jgi:hypothetical protein
MDSIPLQLFFVFGKPRTCVARMLNGAFAFNGEAALWANAPMPEHNSNAQRVISACLPKQQPMWFLKTNK